MTSGAVLDAVLERNLAPPALPRPVLAARFARLVSLPPAARVAAWATFLHARGGTSYVFGDDAEGYASRGRLVDDERTDCMLFTMRVLELAQADTPEFAIERALAGRFPGTAPSEFAGRDGAVDYEHPRRRRFAIDLMRDGAYGTDVTESLGRTVTDPGTGRVGSSVAVVPSDAVEPARLLAGDVAWFVLDPEHAGARRVRVESGALIGHMGILVDGAGELDLVHAASTPLPGVSPGGRVVRVPFREYLRRVERFWGVRFSRLLDRQLNSQDA